MQQALSSVKIKQVALTVHPCCCPQVVSVDCNPAQSALLELKSVAIQQLSHDDVWQMFGEGVHPRIEELFETRLSPFLSQTSNDFWRTRLWYFKQGLYYQGGMVSAGDGLAWTQQCQFLLWSKNTVDS